jgi:hypothetical protein
MPRHRANPTLPELVADLEEDVRNLKRQVSGVTGLGGGNVSTFVTTSVTQAIDDIPPPVIAHADTTGQTPDDHHPESHTHDGDGSGTVEGAVRCLAGTWVQENVAANQVAVVLSLLGGEALSLTPRTALPMIRAGSVTGIVVRSNAARTAGTLTVDVTINGVATGLQAILDAVNITFDVATQAIGTDVFVSGDEIGIVLSTDAGWLPVTADVSVIVEVHQ